MFLLQKVEALCGSGIKKVYCGTQFTVALTKDGRVMACGQGKDLNLISWKMCKETPGGSKSDML